MVAFVVADLCEVRTQQTDRCFKFITKTIHNVHKLARSAANYANQISIQIPSFSCCFFREKKLKYNHTFSNRIFFACFRWLCPVIIQANQLLLHLK